MKGEDDPMIDHTDDPNLDHELDGNALAGVLHALFGSDTEIVFAFHGYPSAIHELVHHRPNPTRFHVRGYVEEGTTTTPFDMTACNRMSRYHIAIEALRRVGLEHEAAPFIRMLDEDHAYIAVHGVDAPRVSGWHWSNHSEDPSC